MRPLVCLVLFRFQYKSLPLTERHMSTPFPYHFNGPINLPSGYCNSLHFVSEKTETPKRLSNVPNITRVIRGRARLQDQVISTPDQCHPTLLHHLSWEERGRGSESYGVTEPNAISHNLIAVVDRPGNAPLGEQYPSLPCAPSTLRFPQSQE